MFMADMCGQNNLNIGVDVFLILFISVININGPSTVKKGESLFLSCNATTEQSDSLELFWLKDNKTFRADRLGRVNITKHIFYGTHTIISNITIKKVVVEDEGNYVCKTGKMAKNLTVQVTGQGSENVKSKYFLICTQNRLNYGHI